MNVDPDAELTGTTEPADASSGVVRVYTTPDCPACALTHKALERAGINTETINLKDRPDLIERFKAEGFYTAPIIETPDGTRTAGFRPDRIKEIASQPRLQPNSENINRESHSGPGLGR